MQNQCWYPPPTNPRCERRRRRRPARMEQITLSVCRLFLPGIRCAAAAGTGFFIVSETLFDFTPVNVPGVLQNDRKRKPEPSVPVSFSVVPARKTRTFFPLSLSGITGNGSRVPYLIPRKEPKGKNTNRTWPTIMSRVMGPWARLSLELFR